MRSFLFNLTVDAVIFGAFYMWQAMHIEAAHTLLAIVLWTIAALTIIGLFGIKPSEKKSRVTVFTIYNRMATVAQLALMVWTGMAAVAAVILIGWMLLMAKLDGKAAA